MSTEQLVAEAVRILIPALPYLVKGLKIGGKKAAEKLGELGTDLSFEQAKKLWSTLKKGKRSRKLEVAAQELAQAPQDKDWEEDADRGVEGPGQSRPGPGENPGSGPDCRCPGASRGGP